MNDQIVSFDDEKLILVDEKDNVLGYESKDVCHNGDGILHRAFSIFIFNSQGELLLQQRSQEKRLWGLYWSNTCCSHPRKGETYEQATMRRLQEELGLKAPLKFLFKFQYQARFNNKGSENELCSVYVGKCDEPPSVNPNEIAAVRYIPPEDLEKEMQLHPDKFTPWFKMEWERIRKEFWPEVEKIISDKSS
ncbi:MAG: isopentenyl-diphosphate Delta-isomerase [Caldisericaceae bacterium]|nr:isopentenyl-diphosphate Delta-isomerase [Caldisericaceae bacterium]